MSAEGVLAGPAAPYIAILAMAAATYLCRASGVLLMSFVRLTPRIERALRALPGSIVVATALPIGAQAGPAALAGLAAAVVIMTVVRNELAALLGAMALVAALRALGL
ncbi:MAG TPA: AzlD domain-containing protein [Beijerinckiaceae bacterium]|nr:AzlD domain-containing protein [Beijerinckiaceae bacterium]